MLLARALVGFESTAGIVDPEVSLTDRARPLLPEFRQPSFPDGANLEAALREHRFEYLALALELPDPLPELWARRSGGQAAQPLPIGKPQSTGNTSCWRFAALAALAGAAAGLAAARTARVAQGRPRQN